MQLNKVFRIPCLSYSQKVLWLLFALSILRITFAFTLELANDESYYWLFAQHLKWNYFDHPPMIALWLRIFTLNLTFQAPGFLRIGSIVSCCIASWFMFKAVSLLSNERAGWFSVCMYNASFYSGITAGFLVMPDAPQMVFWTLSLWMISKLTVDDNKLINWIAVGVSIGLCIMSKVHGIFLWIGLGLFAIFYKRKWFAKPVFYISFLITVIICLPIIFWNIKYNFATYSFNSARIDLYGSKIDWRSYFYQASQQIGLNNPFNVLILVIALFTWKKFQLSKISALKIFNLVGLPFAIILLYIPLFRQNILPHWSGPAYVSLMPVAAIAFDKIRRPVHLPKLIGVTMINYVLYLTLCSLFILYFPGTISKSSTPRTGTKDLSIDFYGWKEGGEKFDSIYHTDVSNKVVPSNTPVICDEWWGAHIEYYFCFPSNIKMIGLGKMMDIHEYLWMNLLRRNVVNLDNAYCIISSDEYYNPKVAYKDYYDNISFVKDISVLRNGKNAHNFYVYRLSGWKGNLPVEN